METAFTPVLMFGAVLFFSGTLVCIALIFFSSRLAIGAAGWRNMSTFFTKHTGAQKVLFIALMLAFGGGLITMGSVVAGDAARNSLCTDACEESGFSSGRYRANPNVPHEPGAPYACWCEGEAGWSAEPVAF